MKKLVCVLLTLTLILCMGVPAFAADENGYAQVANADPVIVVRGISFAGLADEQGKSALQINTNKIINLLIESLVCKFALKDKEALGDAFCEATYDIFEPMSCDNEGNSKYDISMKQFPKSMASYPSYVKNLDGIAEHGILQDAVERYGADKVYYFCYDWRKSPRELSSELKALIETAKADHNVSKVDIVAASMGAMVTTAYFYYCGAESVDSAVYVSGAHNGTYSFGNAINGDIVIDGDVLVDYVLKMTGSNFILRILLKLFDALGAVDFLLDVVNEFISTNFDKANDRVFRDCFGTMPGFWALCPDDCFDSGISTVFAGHESEYPVLLEKLNDARDYVMNTEKTLNAAKDSGVKLTFVSNYNRPLTPVYKNAYLNGDRVLETKLTSNFATVADYGKTLSDAELAGVPAEFVSSDKVVNASTAWFTDITWFVKDADHVATNYGSQYSDFVFWLADSDIQLNVYSDARYPRFMIENAQKELLPLK